HNSFGNTIDFRLELGSFGQQLIAVPFEAVDIDRPDDGNPDWPKAAIALLRLEIFAAVGRGPDYRAPRKIDACPAIGGARPVVRTRSKRLYVLDLCFADIAQIGDFVDPYATQELLLFLVFLAQNGLTREILRSTGQFQEGRAFQFPLCAFQDDDLIEL